MLFDTDRDRYRILEDNADRRSERRHSTVLLMGKVDHGDDQSACLVHDISRQGLMARFTAQFAVGDVLGIEVRGLPAVRGVVRWVSGYRAGVAFEDAQDLGPVFCLRGHDGVIARAPRFALEGVARLTLAGRAVEAELLDISAGGVKLRSASAVECGQAGRIVLPDLADPLFGTVCWTSEERFGVRFVAPLPLVAMARILAG